MESHEKSWNLVFDRTFVQPLQSRRRGLWTSLALLVGSGPRTLAGPRREIGETMNNPYDAKCNVAEIGAVNMGEIGAVRKRSR